MSQKRNRSINWSEEEKQLLRSVLKEFSQIIENKSLDTNSNKVKNKAWEEVHKKFNQLNSRPRDLNQIKIQWKTMKVHARKTFSTFKKEVHKTGGGARPVTPDDSIIEIKDLLNPAELLRDHNLYDSDGIIIGEVEFPTSSETCPIKQDSTTEIVELETSVTNAENQQVANMSVETVEDVDDEVALQEFTPLVITQANAATPMEKYMKTLPAKMSQDDNITVATPVRKSIGANPPKKVPKRTLTFNNNVAGNGLNSRKEQDNYIDSMLRHSKMLKDEEHIKHMEMAKEEHLIKMKMHKEKLKEQMRQMEMAEEKHEITLQMHKEEHELKMKMQKEEHEIKMKIHKEELRKACERSFIN